MRRIGRLCAAQGRKTDPVLLVMHDDFLQGDQSAGAPRASAVHFAKMEGSSLSAKPVVLPCDGQEDVGRSKVWLVPKRAFAQLALQLIVEYARAALEARLGSQVVEGEGAWRGALGSPLEDAVHCKGDDGPGGPQRRLSGRRLRKRQGARREASGGTTAAQVPQDGGAVVEQQVLLGDSRDMSGREAVGWGGIASLRLDRSSRSGQSSGCCWRW